MLKKKLFQLGRGCRNCRHFKREVKKGGHTAKNFVNKFVVSSKPSDSEHLIGQD